jgi:hypothetical protein
MKYKLTILGMLFCAPVFAQTPDSLVENIAQDWQASTTAQRHLFEDLQRLVQAYQVLKAENEKLKALSKPLVPNGP